MDIVPPAGPHDRPHDGPHDGPDSLPDRFHGPLAESRGAESRVVDQDGLPISRDGFAPPPAFPPGAYPPLPAYAEGDEGGILRRLLRRKLLFGAVFLIVAGLVTAVYLYLPATYKAEASVTVLPSDQVLAAQRAAAGDQMEVGDSADLESQALILSSATLLRQLLQKPDMQAAMLTECQLAAPPAWKRTLRSWLFLAPRPSCPEQLANVAGVVADLRGRITVAASGRSRVLTLSFLSRSPEVAQSVANEIMKVYLDLRTAEKLQPRDAAISWLQAESARVAERLKQTEQQVENYLHANGVIRGQVASLASEQLTSLAQQIGQAEAEQAAASGRMQQARLQNGATSAVLQNQTTSDIKQRLAALTSDIAQMASRYGAANPALQELQHQRRDLQQLLGQETGVVNRSAETDYQAATARVGALRQQLDALKQEVRSNDDATTQVAALQRDAATDRELLVDLTRNLNQLETDRRLVTPNARLVSWAEPPLGVFFPKYSVFILGGALLATALATGAALLRDRADRTVRTVAVLQNAAELPVIARIPHVSGIGRGSQHLVDLVRRPSSFQEAIRGLYAECLLVSSHQSGNHQSGNHQSGGLVRRPRSFLVTSSDRGEGKSLTAVALAHFAAAAGRRVLVVECDLRRPDIGRSLSLAAKPGLSELLRRRISPAEAVRGSHMPGLDVILAGKAATDSAELLGSAAMTELLAWACASYDLVILDTPPSRVLPDARILAGSVDCVLYCAQWGHSTKESVIEGVHDIQAAGGRVLGLVLGRVQQAQYRLYNVDDLGIAAYPALTES